jgi:hypothetical protein
VVLDQIYLFFSCIYLGINPRGAPAFGDVYVDETLANFSPALSK